MTVAVETSCEDVPCAYCARPTPPDRRAPGAGVWDWPGKGRVTNCLTCAGYEPCIDCSKIFDNSEGNFDRCDDCLDVRTAT